MPLQQVLQNSICLFKKRNKVTRPAMHHTLTENSLRCSFKRSRGGSITPCHTAYLLGTLSLLFFSLLFSLLFSTLLVFFLFLVLSITLQVSTNLPNRQSFPSLTITLTSSCTVWCTLDNSQRRDFNTTPVPHSSPQNILAHPLQKQHHTSPWHPKST